MSSPGPRYDIWLTTMADNCSSVSQRVAVGLTADDVATQLQNQVERGHREGAVAVKQRWDSAEIKYPTDIEIYDVEPVTYDDPAAALPLLAAALAARWPATIFDVSPMVAVDPSSALKIVWSDGPHDPAVQAFTTQIAPKGFHRAGVVLDRHTSPRCLGEVITAVETEYQLHIPRDGRGRVDWKTASVMPVDVLVTAGEGPDRTAERLRIELADLVRARLYFTDFSEPSATPSGMP